MSDVPLAIGASFFRSSGADDVGGLLARLVLAFLLGLGIAALHTVLRVRRGGTPMTGTLVLLAPLIALVVWAIGDDVATAFGLVGILAIVRFRTIVRDPSDAVYLLFAVAAGVTAAASGYWLAPIVGCSVIGLGLALVSLGGPRWGMGGAPRRLVVRMAVNALAGLEKTIAKQRFATVRSVGLRSLKGGGVVEARYEITAADPAAVDRFVLVLAETEGVHEVNAFRPRG